MATRRKLPTWSTYKLLGIRKPASIASQDRCQICNDTAGKSKVRNRCVFEIHYIYT